MEKKITFLKGDKVRLGDSREGTIVGKRERSGFHGYIVEITKSIDENQVGQTVAATSTTMKKLSQAMSGTTTPGNQNPQAAPPVEEVSQDSGEEKELKKKELLYTQKQIQMLQTKVNDLNQMVAQNTTNLPAGDSMEELDRIDQADQDNVEQQQDVNLAQQDMQQEKLLQDQRMRQEQQTQNMQMQQMQQVGKVATWVHPEYACARIAIKNIELVCDVAATPRQQASGLQSYNRLDNMHGLWFPFSNRRTASFHMGQVKFPIDIVFIDDSKINKIVSNIQPRQMGSWKSLCTDVLEVNGGWCGDNQIRVGDIITTPLTGKKRASSEIERLLNTSDSAPQKARISSDKDSAANSYDTLRSITTAEGDGDDNFESEMLTTFPFLKSAQEHRQPDSTDGRLPDSHDNRNPQIRYRQNTTPDVEVTFGDGDPGHVDPFEGVSNSPVDDENFENGYGKHFDYQRGFWPSPKSESEQEMVPIRPAQKITVPSENSIDMLKLANSSISLYDRYGPKWQEYNTEDGFEEDLGYAKIAIINDELISSWIDTLGFDTEHEEKLRKNMFTDSYKVLLGDTLIASNKITDYEIFDSDLLLYQGEDHE